MYRVRRFVRALTDLLPDALGSAVRYSMRSRLARVGLVDPVQGGSTSSGTDASALRIESPPLRKLLPALIGRRFTPTPALAEIADPESDHAMCPLCGTTVDAFLPYGVKAVRPDCRCPRCGSLERHRLVWLYLVLRTDIFTSNPRFLHVAPEETMAKQIRKIPNIDYLSADIEPGKAMTVMDITSIDWPDHSFDVIYASHVLEHVPDDVLAMSELRRVLAIDGWAILEVPIFGSTTREDPSITDPGERTRLFGQFDHVRMYGHDGEYERRLRQAGFEVTVVDLVAELGPAAARRYRLLPDEKVYLCRPARVEA